MTVAELIAALQKLPADALVAVNGGEGVNDELVPARAPVLLPVATVAFCDPPRHRLDFRKTRNVVTL